ncbi:DNA gyrase subunit A [Microcystis panniformis FACHB-1757]|uniref:DNA gyrase subunit A n=1 Tax=Microcystis panniformis FACHB-1757 TaxID=1638788 RepID=A0A0K1RX21_9CHRO|nr:DNA gyrase subunit A [Microcystis panniformis FACHB-1757]
MLGVRVLVEIPPSLLLPTSPRPHFPISPDNLISVTAPKLYNKGSSINKQ